MSQRQNRVVFKTSTNTTCNTDEGDISETSDCFMQNFKGTPNKRFTISITLFEWYAENRKIFFSKMRHLPPKTRIE